MARSYQRSLRLDDDLEDFFNTLPRGTGNDLINQLLALFRDNAAVRQLVSVKDARFANWKPHEVSPQPVEKPVEKPEPKPVSVLDEITPKV